MNDNSNVNTAQVTAESGFLSVTPDAGTGNGTIKVKTLSENLYLEDRKAKVTFTSEENPEVTVVLEVTQAHAPRNVIKIDPTSNLQLKITNTVVENFALERLQVSLEFSLPENPVSNIALIAVYYNDISVTVSERQKILSPEEPTDSPIPCLSDYPLEILHLRIYNGFGVSELPGYKARVYNNGDIRVSIWDGSKYQTFTPTIAEGTWYISSGGATYCDLSISNSPGFTMYGSYYEDHPIKLDGTLCLELQPWDLETGS